MNAVEQLNEVNKAITSVVGGAQEYWIGSKHVRRADLAALLKERERLEAQVGDEAGSGGVTVAFFDRR